MSQDELPFGAPPEQQEEEDISFDLDTTLMPEGLYKAKVLGVTQRVSNAGNPMLMWEFVILEGDYSGTSMVQFTAITTAAMFKVEETCGALGIDLGEPDPVTGKSPVKFKPSAVVNTLCTLEIAHGEYMGRDRENVQKVHPSSEGIGAKWQPADSVLD